MITAWRIATRSIGHALRRPGLTTAALLAAMSSAAALTFIVANAINDSNQVLDELRTPAARSLLLRADDDITFDTRSASWLAELGGVDNASGLSSVQSARSTTTDDSPRTVGYFELTPLAGPEPIQLESGRRPKPGEIIVSTSAASTLALVVPDAARITTGDRTIGVVGTFRTRNQGRISELLTRSAVSLAEPPDTGYDLIVITVKQPADMATIIGATPQLFPSLQPTDYTIEFDSRLADVETTVDASNRSSIRTLALGIVAIGAAIQAIVAAVNALTQRREIARRRALGATRATILALLISETGALSVLGAAAGTGIATIVLGLRDASTPHTLIAAAITFTTAAGILAAIPGALFGAYQEPATTLRVP